MNEYAIEMLAQQYLAERRAEATAYDRARRAARPRPPLRVSVGQALIRIGTRLAGGLTPARVSA